MKDFQRGGGWKGGNTFGGAPKFGGGRPKFGGRGGSSWGGNDRGGSGDREERVMHNATCNECGNDCQVPFRPNGRKPVFCTNCFKRDGDMGERRGGHDFSDRRSNGGEYFENSFSDEKRMFSTKCDGCGDTCEVPFRPNGRKPTYCHNCFGKGGSGAGAGAAKSVGADVTEEIRLINAKLDTILEVLSSLIGEIEESEDEMGDDAEEVVGETETEEKA